MEYETRIIRNLSQTRGKIPTQTRGNLPTQTRGGVLGGNPPYENKNLSIVVLTQNSLCNIMATMKQLPKITP
tara:strand:- start:2681 stop:2896 length:216 start_codon:yes stop_codon:yes gene_type:complete